VETGFSKDTDHPFAGTCKSLGLRISRKPVDSLPAVREYSRMSPAESEIIIRRCSPSDLSAVGELAARLVREHHAADPNRFLIFDRIEEGYAEFLRGQLRQKTSIVLVAAHNDRVVAYAYGRIEPRDWNALREECGVLHDVYVELDSRRKGVATRLIMEALTVLRDLGAPRIILMTAAANEAAHRLFHALGFRTTMIEMTREM
jgi:ribosomal protein S18 acetylase RimI-like enzyme